MFLRMTPEVVLLFPTCIIAVGEMPPGMVVHAYNSSIGETEAGRFPEYKVGLYS